MRERLGDADARPPTSASTAAFVGDRRSTSSRPGIAWDDDRYHGDAYGSYGWGCNVVELEVDPDDLARCDPTHVTAVAEIGKAIHPHDGRRARSRAARRRGSATRCSKRS